MEKHGNAGLMRIYQKTLKQLHKVDSEFSFTAEYKFKGYFLDEHERFEITVFSEIRGQRKNATIRFYSNRETESIETQISELIKALKESNTEEVIRVSEKSLGLT